MGGKHLSDDLKQRIVDYRANTIPTPSYNAMNKIFNVPVTTMKDIVKKYSATGSVKNRTENRHRPRKTTVRQDRQIVREAKIDPFTNTKTIKENLEAADPDQKISRMTISNRLKEADLSARRPRKVSYKKKIHLKRHVEFAKKYKDCTKKFLEGYQSKFRQF